MPGVIARSGLWPFAVVQASLIWIWFALHAKRLHDAGQPMTLAAGASVLYALSVVLLLIVATAFFTTSPSAAGDANTTGAFGLILLVMIVSTLAGAASYDIGWAVVAILVALGFVPVFIAIAVTLWAATRPRAQEPAP